MLFPTRCQHNSQKGIWFDFCSSTIIFLLSKKIHEKLAGGFKYRMFYFHPEPWEDDPIWRTYFSDGLVQPPTSTWKRLLSRNRWALENIWKQSKLDQPILSHQQPNPTQQFSLSQWALVSRPKGPAGFDQAFTARPRRCEHSQKGKRSINDLLKTEIVLHRRILTTPNHLHISWVFWICPAIWDKKKLIWSHGGKAFVIFGSQWSFGTWAPVFQVYVRHRNPTPISSQYPTPCKILRPRVQENRKVRVYKRTWGYLYKSKCVYIYTYISILVI